MNPNSRKAVTPPSSGDNTQEMAIWPIWPHWTISSPPIPVINPEVTAAPTMPPITECVVETGRPSLVAINSQIAAPSRADIMM